MYQSEEQSQDESSELYSDKRQTKKKKRKPNKKIHKMISSTFQTKRCDFFNKGSCQKGAQCTFSHSFVPDFAKKICKFYLSNSCSKGQNCSYSHDTKRYPCTFFHILRNCHQGEACRFSHGPIDPDFQEQFLKDNEDFLCKAYKSGKIKEKRLNDYVIENKLWEKNNNNGAENQDDNINLPFIFGFPIATLKPKPTSNETIRKQNTASSPINKKTLIPTVTPMTPTITTPMNVTAVKQEAKSENIPKDPRILLSNINRMDKVSPEKMPLFRYIQKAKAKSNEEIFGEKLESFLCSYF